MTMYIYIRFLEIYFVPFLKAVIPVLHFRELVNNEDSEGNKYIIPYQNLQVMISSCRGSEFASVSHSPKSPSGTWMWRGNIVLFLFLSMIIMMCSAIWVHSMPVTAFCSRHPDPDYHPVLTRLEVTII